MQWQPMSCQQEHFEVTIIDLLSKAVGLRQGHLARRVVIDESAADVLPMLEGLKLASTGLLSKIHAGTHCMRWCMELASSDPSHLG